MAELWVPYHGEWRIRRALVQVPARPENPTRGGRGSDPRGPLLLRAIVGTRRARDHPTRWAAAAALSSFVQERAPSPLRVPGRARAARAGPTVPCVPFCSPIGQSSAVGLPRRASSTSFEHPVEGAFRTRHGRKVLLGGAREGTAAPGATGLRTALKRTKSPAAPCGFRCRRDACGGCRWHSGSASSKGTAAGTAGQCARKAEGRRGPHSPIRVDHDRPCPI